jgi:cytosine/adenosine deaminase-related metal-dependent hydrolase
VTDGIAGAGRQRTFWCESAWLGGEQAAAAVAIRVDGDRITEVNVGVAAPPGAVVLPGITLPGLANVHSHAFHRALRGRTHRPHPGGRGSFWTWREAMYALAGRLDPDGYHLLARAAFAEMALAGVTAVGEFHYLHHAADGEPYRDPNAMGLALLSAAADAGIRITLLDTCYLHGGVDAPVEGVQRRFSDGSADRWAERASMLVDTQTAQTQTAQTRTAQTRTAQTQTAQTRTAQTRTAQTRTAQTRTAQTRTAQTGTARIGAAVHSVRAVDPPAIAAVAGWAAERGAPLHVHVSEQPAENEASLARYGGTPTEVLDRAGALGSRTTAVHGTHLTAADRALLAARGCSVCFCPTTERDLADGIGPAAALRSAGVPLCLGSDSNAVVDLFEEARAVELDERLASGIRGRFTGGQLLGAATEAGMRALGWQAGRIEPGRLADLTTVRLDSVRLAGTRPEHAIDAVVFAATGADVTHTVVGGEIVVADGRHQRLGDVAAMLRTALTAV